MGSRTMVKFAYVCICVFAHLYGVSRSATATIKNSENSPQSSGDIIMRADAEEVFYNVDLAKYSDLGITCPEPEPPENGFIIGEGNEVGAVVYVHCHEGYRLDGPPVMACWPVEDAAQWDEGHNVHRECLEDEQAHETLPEVETVNTDTSQGTQPKKSNADTKNISNPPSINPRIHLSWAQKQKRKDRETLEPEEEYQENTHDITVQLPAFCLKKQDTGPCRAAFKRYYFSKATMECHRFLYGGCQGNENNFETLEDCNRACLGHE